MCWSHTLASESIVLGMHEGLPLRQSWPASVRAVTRSSSMNTVARSPAKQGGSGLQRGQRNGEKLSMTEGLAGPLTVATWEVPGTLAAWGWSRTLSSPRQQALQCCFPHKLPACDALGC